MLITLFTALSISLCIAYILLFGAKNNFKQIYYEDHEEQCNNCEEALIKSTLPPAPLVSPSLNTVAFLETYAATMMQFKIQLDSVALQLQQQAQQDAQTQKNVELLVKCLHANASTIIEENALLEAKLSLAAHLQHRTAQQLQYHYESQMAQQRTMAVRRLKRNKMHQLRQVQAKEQTFMNHALYMHRQYSSKTKELKQVMNDTTSKLKREHEEALCKVQLCLAEREKTIEQQQAQLGKFNEALKHLTMQAM